MVSSATLAHQAMRSQITISGGAVNNNTSMYFVRVTFPLGASLYIDNPNLVCVKVSYTTTTP